VLVSVFVQQCPCVRMCAVNAFMSKCLQVNTYFLPSMNYSSMLILSLTCAHACTCVDGESRGWYLDNTKGQMLRFGAHDL